MNALQRNTPSVSRRLHDAGILIAVLLVTGCTTAPPLPSPSVRVEPAPTPTADLVATPAPTVRTVNPTPAQLPTPRPTPNYPAADDRALGAVYAALRPQNLRSASGPRTFTRGSPVVLAYELTNTSSGAVTIPMTSAFERAGHWYGAFQTWIERLGTNTSLDACLPEAARKGTWYAVGGQPAAFYGPTSIGPGEGQTAQLALPAAWTACFPAGRYRLHLEYQKVVPGGAEDVLGAASVEVEINEPTRWTAEVGLNLGEIRATLDIPAGSGTGSSRVVFTGLAPAAKVSFSVRAADCGADGTTLVKATTFTAPADGARTIKVAFDPSSSARRAIRAGSPVALLLTISGVSACAMYWPVPVAAPADRAPTTWGGGLLLDNLGQGYTVTASSRTFGGRPAQAFDRDVNRTWNAGDYPPAWIEIDLGKSASVDGIRLLPSQLPSPAETVHRIYGREDGSVTEVLLGEVSASTKDNVWIDVRFDTPVSVRYVRIATLRSPSWVAWREIALIGVNVPRPSASPAGFHDGSTHGVASGDQCYANGWASDADDRSRDVAIRILVDGEEVWAGLADDPRPDLVSAGVADGSAAFWVDLRGLLSLGATHQVRVQAQDVETGRWFDLGATPRTLTCL